VLCARRVKMVPLLYLAVRRLLLAPAMLPVITT
jgi:hypothetical protein